MLPSFITWDVNPTIIDSFVTVRWYGLMFAIGFWIGFNIVAKMFKREGAPERWLGILLLYVGVATIVGARLGHVFFYQWDYYSAHPWKILATWEGGLASHGGAIGIIIAVILFSIFTSKRNPLLDIRPPHGGYSARGLPDTNRQPDEQRDFRLSYRPAMGIQVYPFGRMAERVCALGLSPDPDLRGSVLFGLVRSDDVDVLAKECRRTPGIAIRYIPYRYFCLALLYRIYQKRPSAFRSIDDSEYGPMA